MIGLATVAATVGVGSVYGLSQFIRTASASVSVGLTDETVTLTPDETVTSVTVAGTVEATYDAGNSQAERAGLTVSVGDSEGEGIAGGSESFTYDELDAPSGEVSEDIALTLDVPPAVADPEPGEAIETAFFADVVFVIDDADGQQITEGIGSDTATLRIEREAQEEETGTDESEETDEENETTELATVDVSASFSFDVETDSE